MYIASALAFEIGDVDELRQRTRSELQRTLDARAFERQLAGPYRSTVYGDPDAFAEQLAFYRIRPVFNAALWGMYRLGIPLGQATQALPASGALASILLLYLLARRRLTGFALAALPPLAVAFQLPDLARLSTPDGWATCIMLLAALWFLRERWLALCVLLPLSIGLRTDLVLLALPLLLVIAISQPHRRIAAALAAVVCVALDVALGAWAGNPGWATLVHHTLIEKLAYPVSTSIELSLTTYAGLLGRGLLRAMANVQLIAFVAMTVAAWLATPAARRGALWRDPEWQLVAVGWVYALAHFVLFPVAWNRFFTAPYLLTAIVALAVLSRPGLVEAAWSRKRPAERGYVSA